MLLCLVGTSGRAEPGRGTNNSPGSPPLVENHSLETPAEARLRFARERRSLPSHGLYEDIRGIIRGPSVESAPIKDAQQRLLAEAKQRNIRVVLTADHESPKPEAWRGLHAGVLFLAG